MNKSGKSDIVRKGHRKRKSTARFTYEEFQNIVNHENGFATEGSMLRIRQQLFDYVKNSGGYRLTVDACFEHLMNHYKKLPPDLTSKGEKAAILGTALFICEKYKVNDKKVSGTISLLAPLIKPLEWFSVLSPIQNFCTHKAFLYGKLSPASRRGLLYGPKKKQLDALQYYLYHGRTLNYFIYDESQPTPINTNSMEKCRSLVDLPLYIGGNFSNSTPLSLACLGGQPSTVLLLLKNGAQTILKIGNQSPFTASSQPYTVLVNHLNEIANVTNSSDVSFDSKEIHGRIQRYFEIDRLRNPTMDRVPNEYLLNRTCRLLICLIYLLRASFRIPIVFSDDEKKIPSSAQAWNSNGPHKLVLFCRFKQYLPNLDFNVSSLQQLCRLAINKRLFQIGNLPYGVSELGLPKSLRQYVAFERD
ncbi:DgyrCDS5695 [Dimorphilus gyrociliatus]|uniref:DgyrCDS5695 n=1 Tax=Dimorphilus gyrociliatus TaxID=2664684 RepID=A0A7I8VKP1_9ANNE|nr:DgyrCDS5695 [Dimorphilus gyrociliatus]